MTAMWLTLALGLALVGVLLALFYWQRRDLERLRAYDVAAERFHRAAMRLLKYEDLPQDIVAVIEVINECTASPEKAHMAIERVLMAQKESEKDRHRHQEARRSLDAFVERHPETRRLLQDMIMNGLTALLLRLGPVERWNLRSLMRVAERRMLREDKVATALADKDLVHACHA